MEKEKQDKATQEVEKLQSLYLNKEILKAPPVKLFRVETHNTRVYYAVGKDGYEFFPGVTGFLNKVLPTPQELIDWLVMMGDKAGAYVKERTDYGVLMHGQFVPLMIEGEYNLDSIRETVYEYCKWKKLTVNEEKWTRELKKDILAFAHWLHEYQVSPLAAEIPLVTRKYGIATLVDLVCTMVLSVSDFWGEEYKSGVNKGQPKKTKKDCKVYAVVDFKSRRKAYVTLADELQLAYGEAMVKECYPHLAKEEFKLFSWHPKDWRTAPGSHFTEHTIKHTDEELELYSRIYHLNNDVNKYTRLDCSGIVQIGEDLSENYSTVTLSEIIDFNLKEKEEK